MALYESVFMSLQGLYALRIRVVVIHIDPQVSFVELT